MSHASEDLHEGRPAKERRERGLSWPVKATLLFLALLAGFFDHAMSGWGRTLTMAAAAIVVPVLLLQHRRFWSQSRFWITVSLLALLQWPLAIATRPLIEKASSLNMLAFGTIDGLVVIAVIFFVCSESGGAGS